MAYIHPAWAVLGIEPTEDKRAIKRAYAARLKATDVDADPKAFIALREALQDATWDSEYLQYRTDEEDEVALLDPEPEAETATPDPLAPISDDEVSPLEDPHAFDLQHPDEAEEDYEDDPDTWRWEPERQSATAADQERIVQLLWGDAPIEEIEVELVERTHAILTAPEMENIDHATAIEDWMASMIAQSIPRSDAMARLAVPHFGWATQVDDWRQRWGVTEAARRLAEIEALDRIARPDHRWHQAWTILKQPPPDAPGWKAVAKHRPEIVAMMQSIRHHTPALEQQLNAEHVALWDAAIADDLVKDLSGVAKGLKGSGFSWWWVFWAVFILAQLARFAA